MPDGGGGFGYGLDMGGKMTAWTDQVLPGQPITSSEIEFLIGMPSAVKVRVTIEGDRVRWEVETEPIASAIPSTQPD